MEKFLLFCFATVFVRGENVTEVVNATEKIEMLRITQPSNGEVMRNKTEVTTKGSVFKASPQLESYLEYNRFPVVAVWPEAKQVKSFQQIQSENQIRLDKQRYQSIYPSTTTVVSITRPSQFAQDKHGKPIRSDINDYSPLKFYDKFNYGAPTAFPAAPSLDLYNAVTFPENKPPLEAHPYPFIPPEEHKNEFSIFSPQKTLEYEEAPLEGHVPRKSPWKKVVKFLAAVIPIGLLLSALTPTIVNIGTPINTTQPYCRKDGARLDEPHILAHFEEQWAKNYGCAARELCQISVDGKIPNIEVVKRIINLATTQENEDEASRKLDIISDAIKNKKCHEIPCKKKRKRYAKTHD